MEIRRLVANPNRSYSSSVAGIARLPSILEGSKKGAGGRSREAAEHHRTIRSTQSSQDRMLEVCEKRSFTRRERGADKQPQPDAVFSPFHQEEYHALQKLGEFETKRSSWLKTPPDIRKLGGAIWGGRSYGRVFIGSNGAESYFSSRKFRASLRV